ncbi:Putative zn(2)Cys(6) fungal-type DNA-binding domain-containing protein [Colletotrichum destructivum]|uniref:Zn(2)Cys(6) fungal-type DNA-binding domain-containing protein n=1 Tax=Colletotrichum destructivum TaxID=34406 RepID=A0AAX4IT73_9PEZI|nr:Putative zn(2)Cys(6) fungal-type DNA-binding domain-containing protein [Colletotrichum destructivum]
MRRQNSSCDQCRKGKRACDAGALKDIQLCLDVGLQWEVDWQSTTGPCSNCTKTGKHCTFDWARSQQAQVRGRRQSSGKTNLPDRKRLKSGHKTASPATMEPGEVQPGESHSHTVFNFLDTETHEETPEFFAGSFKPGPDFFSISTENDVLSYDTLPDNCSFVFSPSSSISIPSLSDGLSGLNQTDCSSSQSESISGFSPGSTVGISKTARKRSRQSPISPPCAPSGLSEFSPTQKMIVRTNHGIMTDNLMQLYHDVMEGALSCWLTEQNCPYLDPTRAPGLAGLSPSQPFEPFVATPNLSSGNRIYQRVIRLDKSLESLGIRTLSVSEDRRATKALRLAIMAFTAQWAQGSRRSRARYRPANNPGEDLTADGFSEEFDATLQASFWNQARRCLDDCAEINSFRVAMAELLFGLTQKYNDELDWEDAEFGDLGFGLSGETCTKGFCTAEKVQRVLDEEGYSIYVERGARRLHVLKRRSEVFERGRKNRGFETHSEEKNTVKLVFWLAVMFDTLSAAITERPLTVSDEDSQEDGQRQGLTDRDEEGPASPVPTKRWNDEHIMRKHRKLAPLRLPSPEDAVARELIDAAPVKVLLFRKITRIQSLSSRGAGRAVIEDAIQDGLAVYRHWNMTYGLLFQDCVQCHGALPPRTRSWYVCLLGHWLLAVMIMANCVEVMDGQGFSESLGRRERAEVGLVGHLRRTGARAVSDLARASTPREDDAERLTDFHPAVSEGALLTEPWTMVLIRSFATAGTLLLGEAVESETSGHYAGDSRLDSLDRCEDCVKALWYLGRKSSLSRQVAGILGGGLAAERSRTLRLDDCLAAYDPSALVNVVESY